MAKRNSAVTIEKCLPIVEKGTRAKWWRRNGTPSRGFRYTDANGKALAAADVDRIKALVIPPAWRFVRISPHPTGKLQAVGVDTTGRIQYLYNADFVRKQERKKFAKIKRFGKNLPLLREQARKDIGLEGLPREKVLAVMIGLINSLYFRVGTDASARVYRTYGITTLKNEHLSIGKNGHLLFEFTGKSHVKHRKIAVDKTAAKIMTELKKVGPKKKLFHYLNGDAKPCAVKPADINRYIKAAMGDEFSSKDLRTWGASVVCAAELAKAGPAEDESSAAKNIVETIKYTAEELGNTPAVCRASYVHPAILEAYEKGITLENFRRGKKPHRLLNKDEAALIKLLDKAK